MDILYTDKYIVVCRKETGELSEGEGHHCLPTLLSEALAQKGETDLSVFPVHRLDKETSGLIVFARTQKSAAALSEHVRDGRLSKEYLAVVCGTPEKKSDTLCDLLFYDRHRGKAFVVNRERAGVKKAVLDYTLKESVGNLSLLHIHLHTGRTHQIRVQLSSRSVPIYGDRRYGAHKTSSQGIALLSHRLSFPHPKSGKPVEFSVPPPKCEPWICFTEKTM